MKWPWILILVLSILGAGWCIYCLPSLIFVADGAPRGSAMAEWAYQWLGVFEWAFVSNLLLSVWAVIRIRRAVKAKET